MNLLHLSVVLFVAVITSSRTVVGGTYGNEQQLPSVSSIADKLEPINTHASLQQQMEQQRLTNRSPFFDTLFNIPIQTLRAVNELVQGISGSVQSFMSTRPRPLRSIFQTETPSARRKQERQYFNERLDDEWF